MNNYTLYSLWEGPAHTSSRDKEGARRCQSGGLGRDNVLLPSPRHNPLGYFLGGVTENIYNIANIPLLYKLTCHSQDHMLLAMLCYVMILKNNSMQN